MPIIDLKDDASPRIEELDGSKKPDTPVAAEEKKDAPVEEPA